MWDVNRFIEEEDFNNPELDKIPVRNGCAGMCGCTGYCREIAGYVSREDAALYFESKRIVEKQKELQYQIVKNARI